MIPMIRLVLFALLCLLPLDSQAQLSFGAGAPVCTHGSGAAQLKTAGSPSNPCGELTNGYIARVTDGLSAASCATGGGTSVGLLQYSTATSSWACISVAANIPAGNISSTTTQGAINELDAEKLSIADALVNGPQSYSIRNEFDSSAAMPGFSHDSSACTAAQVATSASGVPGSWSFTHDNTAAGDCYVSTSFSAGKFVTPGIGTITFNALVKIDQLSDGTNTYTYKCGLSDAAVGGNGVGFSYEQSVSASWRTIASATSVTAAASTSKTVDVNWTNLKLVVDAAGANVSFYVDGTLISTVSTGIPAVPLALYCGALKSASTTATPTISYDLIEAKQVYTTERGL